MTELGDEWRLKNWRVNAYVCDVCGGVTTTVDIDEGVTPFTLSCRATEGCKGYSRSQMYPRGVVSTWVPSPSYEWYKPKGKELRGIHNVEELEHIKAGGLMLRRRTDATPLCHDD